MTRIPDVRTWPHLDALGEAVAGWLLSLALAKAGPFSLCLSGGSTPRALYERFVPPDDPQSNFRMTREALLDHVPIPPGQVHPIPTRGLTPLEAAQAYQAALQAFYGAERLDPARPLFDVALLGLGPDGHTASLFPGSSVLAEREAWTAPVVSDKPQDRITLTYPALESSRHTAFLVAGREKAAVLRAWRDGDRDLPAAALQPIGELLAFCAAARGLGLDLLFDMGWIAFLSADAAQDRAAHRLGRRLRRRTAGDLDGRG